MTNAKEEFIKHIADRIVSCAVITFSIGWDKGETFLLKVDHYDADYDRFLQEIDRNYDSGYGGQELYGNIWYTDGTWSERGEYDGSEWWEYNSCPQIPKELIQ